MQGNVQLPQSPVEDLRIELCRFIFLNVVTILVEAEEALLQTLHRRLVLVVENQLLLSNLHDLTLVGIDHVK